MWPFGKKQTGPSQTAAFHAKDGPAFFQMQCKFGRLDLTKNRANVAIVLDARKVLGGSNPVRVSADGCQVAVLQVADEDGGFVTIAQTPSKADEKLAVGDLVLWVPASFDQALGEKLKDARAGWVGLIRAKIAPEYDFQSGKSTVLCRYD